MENFKLKFRAWHINYHEMLGVSQLWLDPEAHHWGSGIVDQRNNFHNSEDIILMQYTGLKDSKAKEICEGDIVMAKLSEHTKDLIRGKVVFKKGGFFIEAFLPHSKEDVVIDIISEPLFKCLIYDHVRVIKNIYENYELLGDE